jgi:pimeloyl-ACP methyl ester carboxylesterase
LNSTEYSPIQITTPVLDITCATYGNVDGQPVVLLHGFPYDVHVFDAVGPILAAHKCRVFVPYLRGYGPTRFLSVDTPRSGQQAALAKDLLDLLDALNIERATLAGHDWGGRAACIVAALWPERVRGLVTQGGYNLQNIAASVRPAPPEQEHRLWYQYYFHTERGRDGLSANRYPLCRLLWQQWSPTWAFTEETYARTAAAFDNPDFVDVVIQSYRHRYGYSPGDPSLDALEAALARQPAITVPTIAMYGLDDGVNPAPPEGADAHFTGAYERRDVPGAGHNLGQEKPEVFAQAVLDLAQP